MSRSRLWKKVVALIPSPKGRSLLLAGIMFVMVGFSNIVTSEEIHSGLPAYNAYAAQFYLFPNLVWWGSFFCVVGLVAIVSAFKGRHWAGFFSLMLMAMWWAGLYGASLTITGYTRIIPSIFTWGLISVFLYTISSWQEVENEE